MRVASMLALTLMLGTSLPGLAADLPTDQQQQQDRYSALSQTLEAKPQAFPVVLRYAHGTRTLFVHNRKVASRLKATYSRGELASWARWLEAARTTRLPTSARGLVQAADRTDDAAPDATHYDAVWVRDSAWAYFALSVQPTRRQDAGRVVRELLRYFATDAQRARFDGAIAHPEWLHLPDGQGAMNAVHIRFDGKSPTYDDVKVDGKPEVWNHKQNDALGLFLLALMDACDRKLVDPATFNPAEWQALSRFVPYFKAIRYDTFEDSGAWEEIERLNTSSVGIVTRALERMRHGFLRPTPLFTAWRAHLKDEPEAIARVHDDAALDQLIERGYVRVQSQLPEGESPSYPAGSLKYRTADAALLNLIAPASLEELSMKEKRRILAHVGTLVGEVGVKRYQRDSYQAGNYWFKALFANDGIAATGNASDDWAFKKREEAFISNSEAQWFFDTWISYCYSHLYAESHDPRDRQEAFYFLNRGLAQITADPAALGADGLPSKANQLPESYNTVVLKTGARHLVPSPIVPLNWAKATMILAIDALEKTD